MKMQNELRAPYAGKVTRLRIKAGVTVEQKQILLNLAAVSPDALIRWIEMDFVPAPNDLLDFPGLAKQHW